MPPPRNDRGLFAAPGKATRPLSALYGVAAYRSSAEERARYTRITAARKPTCDECFANQHELKVAALPRALAKVRRSFKGGPNLNLCGAHAEAWRERDGKDANGDR